MYAVAAKVLELDYFTHLNKKFQSDLHWWNTFLGQWNGVSFFQPKVMPDIAIQTPPVHGVVQPSVEAVGYNGSG